MLYIESQSVSQQSHWLSLWPPWWTSPRICDYKCGCVFVVWVVLGQPLQYLCQPLSAWSFCRQKVQADSLPHVVCLKCDPDEVIAMLRKGLTHKVKKDCISNNKKNKHTEQCLRLYLDLFRATQPSCIFKALERNKAGLDCSVRWAWCDWKKNLLAVLVCHAAQVCTYDRMGLGFSKRLMQNETTGTEKVWDMSTTGRWACCFMRPSLWAVVTIDGM